LCLLFQVIGNGTIDDVEKAEASEKVEVRGLNLDAFSALGSAGHLAGKSHDGWGVHRASFFGGIIALAVAAARREAATGDGGCCCSSVFPAGACRRSNGRHLQCR
jgi:hypothetical protein